MVGQSAVAEKVVTKSGVDAFDPELAKRVWGSAFMRNPSDNFWEFMIEIPGNGTKLIVGVSKGRTVTLHIDLVTADCPPLNEGSYQPHQRLVSLGCHGIKKIIYHPEEGYIDFQLSRETGENNREARIFSGGYFWVNCS